MSVMVFLSAVGPWLFSQCELITGGYGIMALSILSAVLLLFMGAWRADNPQKRAGTPATPERRVDKHLLG